MTPIPPPVRRVLVLSAVGLLSWGALVYMRLERRAAAVELYDRFRSGAR